MSQQRFVVWPIDFEVERNDLLAPNGDDSIDPLYQGQRLVLAEAYFGRVFRCSDNPFCFLKEPLSFLTGRSGFSVIHPVNRLRHDELLVRNKRSDRSNEARLEAQPLFVCNTSNWTGCIGRAGGLPGWDDNIRCAAK